MRVLVTYFAPFGTDTLNASALAAKLLPEELPGAEIRKAELPVAFHGAEEALEAAIKTYSPDLVLCTGQAEGTSELHLERVAINMRDARMPDNAGVAPDQEFIVPDGPAAYFATLPVKKLALELRAAGIPAAVSNSAGTYVEVLWADLSMFPWHRCRQQCVPAARHPWPRKLRQMGWRQSSGRWHGKYSLTFRPSVI